MFVKFEYFNHHIIDIALIEVFMYILDYVVREKNPSNSIHVLISVYSIHLRQKPILLI